MPSFTNSISSKLPEVPTSIFTVMSALANQHDAINLSQGFPNFSIDPVLSELVNKAMTNDYNQYAPMAGIIGLRDEISKKINNQYGVFYHPETEITITAGATQALFTAMAASIERALDSPIPEALLNEAIQPFSEHEVIKRHFEVLGISGSGYGH